MHDVKVYLIFWCSPSPLIISTYETEGDTEEISKEQMKLILESRKDDKEAVEFLKNLKMKKLDSHSKPTSEPEVDSQPESVEEESSPGIFAFLKF